MLIAFLADIHGNREALEACLADAAQAGAERYVFLGDLVGYGADPAFVVDRVSGMAAEGAVVIRGNHDQAVFDPSETMNAEATAAIAWTRTQLSPGQIAFLSNLPMTAEDGERFYVHASAAAPSSWLYITGQQRAEQAMRATPHRYIFCGHTHFPAVFNATAMAPPAHHVPTGGRPIPMLPQRRWLAVLGSVGQPRDQNPDACYGLLDDKRNTLTYVRVPYDAAIAARKIRLAGLPPFLAARLTLGI